MLVIWWGLGASSQKQCIDYLMQLLFKSMQVSWKGKWKVKNCLKSHFPGSEFDYTNKSFILFHFHQSYLITVIITTVLQINFLCVPTPLFTILFSSTVHLDVLKNDVPAFTFTIPCLKCVFGLEIDFCPGVTRVFINQ